MVASFGSKPGNGKSEVKAMTNHQSRECRNVYISSSEPPVQWPVEAVPKEEDFPDHGHRGMGNHNGQHPGAFGGRDAAEGHKDRGG